MIYTDDDHWKGKPVPRMTENGGLEGDKIVVWEMENGHKHGFFTDRRDWREDDLVPDRYRDYDLADQGDYAHAVQEHERTTLVDVREYTLDAAGYREGVRNGDFEIRVRNGDFKIITIDPDEIDNMTDEEIEEAARMWGLELP